MNKFALALAGVLAASLAANLALLHVTLDARERAAKAEEAQQAAVATAKKCGESVRQLQLIGERQRQDAQAEIEAARKTATDQRKIAERERRRPQAVPGNDCASAEVETREWLQRRQGAAK